MCSTSSVVWTLPPASAVILSTGTAVHVQQILHSLECAPAEAWQACLTGLGLIIAQKHWRQVSCQLC